jgi:hypothetical protein
MLLGMANPLAEAVAASGVELRMYIPMGDLLAGIAYLIRRLMEKHGQQFGAAPDLRRSPECGATAEAAAARPRHRRAPPLRMNSRARRCSISAGLPFRLRFARR